MTRTDTETRLTYIDDCLVRLGSVSATDIQTAFGVSPQEASADLGAFLKLCPGRMQADEGASRYKAATHQPVFSEQNRVIARQSTRFKS